MYGAVGANKLGSYIQPSNNVEENKYSPHSPFPLPPEFYHNPRYTRIIHNNFDNNKTMIGNFTNNNNISNYDQVFPQQDSIGGNKILRQENIDEEEELVEDDSIEEEYIDDDQDAEEEEQIDEIDQSNNPQQTSNANQQDTISFDKEAFLAMFKDPVIKTNSIVEDDFIIQTFRIFMVFLIIFIFTLQILATVKIFAALRRKKSSLST